MRYVFHPEALSEYAEAVQYYTEQRVEVAQAFINAIEIQSIGSGKPQPAMLRLMKMFDGVWRVSSPMEFSIQLSKTTF